MWYFVVIDCFVGGSDVIVFYIFMYVGGCVNVFIFGGSGILVV